jgi:hypothetical protein
MTGSKDSYPETLRLLEDVNFVIGYLDHDPHGGPARDRLEAVRRRLEAQLIATKDV